MNTFKSFLAVVLCIAIPFTIFAGENGYKVTYDGGSLPDIKSGIGLHMYMDQDKVRFVKDGKEIGKRARFRDYGDQLRAGCSSAGW